MNAQGRFTIVCVAVLAAALGLVSTAEAGWSRPKMVARTPVQRSALAASPRQGASVAWVGQTRAMAARRTGPRGGLGPVKLFSDPLTDLEASPQVAVAASGATVMVWSVWQSDDGTGQRASTLFARRMSARGKLGPIRAIAHEPDFDSDDGIGQQVAMDAAGNATIAWQRVVTGDSGAPHGEYTVSASVRIRRLAADGSLGPDIGIPTEGGLDERPALAVEPSGRAVIALVRRVASQYSVRAALLDRDGRLGTVQDVSPPGPYWSGQAATVAIDGRSRAAIAWVEPGPEDHQRVAARQLSSRGLGPLHLLSPVSSPFGPVVAVDAAGATTIAWRQVGGIEEGFANRVAARQIRRGGAVGRLLTLSSGGGEVSEPVLAADGLGNATVLWAQGGSVRARRISSSGRLGRPRTLSAGGVEASWPAVAADARGVVTAVWSAPGAIQASRFVPRAPADRRGS
jgi:hypothetical protein